MLQHKFLINLRICLTILFYNLKTYVGILTYSKHKLPIQALPLGNIADIEYSLNKVT